MIADTVVQVELGLNEFAFQVAQLGVEDMTVLDVDVLGAFVERHREEVRGASPI